ncbi:PREDICTED: Retrovirus-related Pol poly from transposon [Prunus dulcis]|uniref:PREDICTED: Retrovirus-related Pol poly from transposon n=1 Tax=Prunus dulcis TaxID=3755 RepID=A0A5E4EMF0_PRUDU|nr:PREDICTED: Retrovirus-related Pol poly from transposon [Prunus dulcis]
MVQDTAKQTWKKLEEMFEGKSLSNKLFLKEKLLNLWMKEGANLMEHLSSFNRCVNDLQRMEVIYSTEDKALMLLTSLHPSYKHFRTTLMFEKEKALKVKVYLLRPEREAVQGSVKARKAMEEGQHPRQKKVVSSVGQRSTGRIIAPHGRRRRTKGRTHQKHSS